MAELKHLTVTGSPADGTTVTGSNTNLVGVSIGASNTYTIEAADSYSKRTIKAVQGAANQLTSYLDLTAAVTKLGGVQPLKYTWGGTPVTTTVGRWYPDTGHATNLGSLLITSTNRLQFTEAAGSGTALNVTSTGTAMTPGTDYMLVYLLDVTANTFTASVYPVGSTSAVFTISGTLGGAMADASGVQSYRHGINTASTSMTLWTSEGLTLFDNTAVRYDVANVAPTANAGVDQTADPGATVTLTGSGTDTDGTIASYAWAQTSGTTVTLTGTGASRTFAAPITTTGATLLFQLTVTDDQAATGTDTIQVTVTPAEGRLHDGSSVKGSAGLLTT